MLISHIGLIPMPADDGPAKDNKSIEASNYIRGICQAMNTFKREYGFFPPGTSAQIMMDLTSGKNPKRIVFLEARNERFNAAGDFLDPWGTPIRIGSLASGLPWAYSFGPNKIDEGGGEYSDDIASW